MMWTILGIVVALAGGLGYAFWRDKSESGGKYSGQKRKLKASGRQLFYGLLDYSWSSLSTKDRRALISDLVENGWTGVSFELMERLAWWPRGDPAQHFVNEMKAKVDKLKAWVNDCHEAGLWCYVRDNNSNADVNKQITSVDQLKQVANYMLQTIGIRDNLIRLPVSETDSDLRSSIRDAYIAYVESQWPRELTSAMSHRRSDARWVEHHQGHISDKGPSGDTSVATSDTGSILIELCGGVTGKTMNVSKAKDWVGKMLRGGCSVDLYALGTGVDAEIIKQVGQTGRAAGV